MHSPDSREYEEAERNQKEAKVRKAFKEMLKYEWKEFELRNLPDLTKKYEFQKAQGEGENFDWWDWELENVEAVCELEQDERIRYRKPTTKAPSHSEKISLWWKIGKEMGYRWYKVSSFSPENSFDGALYEIARDQVRSEWFTGRESALIPPEK